MYFFLYGLKNSDDNEKTFIVIEVAGKTAKQFYDNSIKYVNQTYENPSEVIKGNTEAEYLSFDTYAPSFLYIKNGGVKVFFNAKFKTEIHFKDSKVKYEIISLEIINDANGMPLKFTGGGLDWTIYNKKGILKRENAKEELRDIKPFPVLILHRVVNTTREVGHLPLCDLDLLSELILASQSPV